MATKITITVGKTKRTKKPKTSVPSYGPVWGRAFGSRSPTKPFIPKLRTGQAIKGGIAFGRTAAPGVKFAAGAAVKGGRTAIGFARGGFRKISSFGKKKSIYD